MPMGSFWAILFLLCQLLLVTHALFSGTYKKFKKCLKPNSREYEETKPEIYDESKFAENDPKGMLHPDTGDVLFQNDVTAHPMNRGDGPYYLHLTDTRSAAQQQFFDNNYRNFQYERKEQRKAERKHQEYLEQRQAERIALAKKQQLEASYRRRARESEAMRRRREKVNSQGQQ